VASAFRRKAAAVAESGDCVPASSGRLCCEPLLRAGLNSPRRRQPPPSDTGTALAGCGRQRRQGHRVDAAECGAARQDSNSFSTVSLCFRGRSSLRTCAASARTTPSHTRPWPRRYRSAPRFDLRNPVCYRELVQPDEELVSPTDRRHPASTLRAARADPRIRGPADHEPADPRTDLLEPEAQPHNDRNGEPAAIVIDVFEISSFQ
jgi:hypothetical protein